MRGKRTSDFPKGFLGIHFKCCNVYQRVYRNQKGNAYEGNCPKCYRRVVVRIGAKGSNSRFFEAA